MGRFMKRNCKKKKQKKNKNKNKNKKQKEFRAEKVIKREGSQLYVRWKGYDSLLAVGSTKNNYVTKAWSKTCNRCWYIEFC